MRTVARVAIGSGIAICLLVLAVVGWNGSLFFLSKDAAVGIMTEGEKKVGKI